MCFPTLYTRAASHTQTAPPHVSSPHVSARLSPYAGAVLPYVSTAPPCSHQAPKIRPQFQRDQRFRPRKPGIRGPPQTPCVDCRRGTTCPDGASNLPRPAFGSLKPTHPTGLRGFPDPTTTAARRCKGSCPAFSARLKAGPGTAARLEAGSCGEVFACLFRVCAVLSHQVCADGSVLLFCRRLPKAGLSGPATSVADAVDRDLGSGRAPGVAQRTGPAQVSGRWHPKHP